MKTMPIHRTTPTCKKAMDSLDHDLLTGETLDVGDKVTRRLSQEQATLPHPAAKSSGPIQSKQEITAEAVKKMNCVPFLGHKKWEAVHMRVAFLVTSYRSGSVKRACLRPGITVAKSS